jgi:biotin carboxyl carrier protein
LKLRIEVDGQDYTLDLRRNGMASEYALHGLSVASGTASVVEVMPGVFSILLGHRSFTARVVPNGDDLEVWTSGERRLLSIADVRDRSAKSRKMHAVGPVEVRAQMPGKVIKLLVQLGASVQAGQGLIVVEAMKMQNEMKSPKDGMVSKIPAVEGSTVAAGEPLIVVE